MNPEEAFRLRSLLKKKRYGILCGAVVEAFGGMPAQLYKVYLFLHEDASPLEGILRNLLSICLSETVAVALIAAEREDMPDGTLKDLLTEFDQMNADTLTWVATIISLATK